MTADGAGDDQVIMTIDVEVDESRDVAKADVSLVGIDVEGRDASGDGVIMFDGGLGEGRGSISGRLREGAK